MSVTFFCPADNKQLTTYECQCVDVENVADPDCWECKGTGSVSFEQDVHSLNVCAGNAADFLKYVCDIEFDLGYTWETQEALLRFKAQLELVLSEDGWGEKSKRYADVLIGLCNVAIARESSITVA